MSTTTTRYYVEVDGNVYGPMDSELLSELFPNGVGHRLISESEIPEGHESYTVTLRSLVYRGHYFDFNVVAEDEWEAARLAEAQFPTATAYRVDGELLP